MGLGPQACLGYVRLRSNAVRSRTSGPVARRSAWRGGFDSHAFPPDGGIPRPSASVERSSTTETRLDVDTDRPTETAQRRTRARGPARHGRGRRRAGADRRRPQVVDDERGRLSDGASPRGLADLAEDARHRLADFASPGVEPVINATGVIIHTNLGRAPWPEGVAAAAAELAGGYALLELDRATGRRGARARVAEDHLVALTGAEDALVTNNNAAAVALAVGLAGRGGIVVSRGELVEIGGGVRIPEIVKRAGAKLIEVGTTNRTRAADFEAPLAEGRARAILRVHPSNFTMAGFTETPDAAEVAAIAHRYDAIVIDDLGSGALLDTAAFGLAHEPLPGERLAAGSDVVTFSGDKLVGGPQAGLVVGRATWSRGCAATRWHGRCGPTS